MTVVPVQADERRWSYPLVSWYFLRVSGMLLLVLALGHLLFVHYLSAPTDTNAAFVSARWSQTFWLGFDWLLLLMALLHGLAGLHGVARDYLQLPAARRAASIVIALVAALFLVVGSAIIVTFDPARLGAGSGAFSRQTWVVTALDGLLTALATITYGAVVGVAAYALRQRVLGRPAGIWSFAGQWAWALHRLTGVAIVGFLLIHVLDILLLPLAPDLYNRTISSYASPYLIPMEIAIVGAVLYHSLNGVRLLVLEFGSLGAKRRQAQLFFAVLGASVLLLLPSIVVLLRAGR